MTDRIQNRYFVVDAFTSQPFSGNPAAVVPLWQWKEDRWLQNVAMEMNLSETAFFVADGNGFHLRCCFHLASMCLRVRRGCGLAAD